MPNLACEQPSTSTATSLQEWLNTRIVIASGNPQVSIAQNLRLDDSEYYRQVSSSAPLEQNLWRVRNEIQARGGSVDPVRSARLGLQLFHGKGIFPKRIVRSFENGVTLFFRNGDRRVEVEFLADDSVSVVMYSTESRIDVLDVPRSSELGEIALHAIADFLVA
jgi:hypothetical protein